MDFAWSTEQEQFRERVRAVLARELPVDWAARTQYDNSCDFAVSFARRFCPILSTEGLLIPHWSKTFGGQDLSAFYHWILSEEMWAAGEPRSYQYMNVNWVGPAIIKFGTPAQQEEHLSLIRRGVAFYCQGFSEPNAGSDLASLRTRARRTSRGYIVSGSKIWTSAASFADYCVLLARTGDEGRRGISVFLVPMASAGITVKRIASFQGQRSFHEVFLNDIELPCSSLLGEENQGWNIVTEILANERVGAPRYALAWRGLDCAVRELSHRNRFVDNAVRAAAARCRANLEAARLLALRVIDGRVKGRPPGPETNIARNAGSFAEKSVHDFLGEFASDLIFSDANPLISAVYRRAGSAGIAAGSAEVQLNLIARHLGLPRSLH